MAKGNCKQDSKHGPIHNGRVITLSKTTSKKSQPLLEKNNEAKKFAIEEDDGHQCHYGDD